MSASRRLSRVRFVLGLVFLAALCVSCTAPKVAYQRLDWLASWKLGQYVDLKAPQERRFEASFKQLWDWHRAQELAGYSHDLRELAQAAQAPITAEGVRGWADRVDAHSRRVMDRAGPAACELMASFDSSQRDSVLGRIDQGIAEDVEEYLEPPVETVRKGARKRLRKSLVRWVGDLEPAQEAMVERWSQVRPQRYAEWIAERRRWRDRFAAVLDQRGDPGFCERIKSLLVQPDADQGRDADLVNQRNAQGWFEFLAGFSATLDQRQRAHLRDRLVELADDFDSLHTQPG